MESNWNSFEIRSIRFENLRFDWFEKEKKFEKFDNFQFEIRSIRKKIIRKIRKFFKFSFIIRKIRKFFLSKNILSISILGFGSHGTLYWRCIIYYHLICGRLKTIKVLYNGSIRKICNQFDSNSIRKFWKSIRKSRKIFGLPIRNLIRFESKIIRFVRFENFLIRLIRKSIFYSKNSRKINSKFVRFDSTPPLA